MQAAFLQFSLNLCSYPQYSTQGGGASKFHEEVHQFSEWCSFPCEEWGTGELCRCCIRSRRTARRPFFLRFPARGQKAVHGPRASGGGAPTRHMPAPPRARSRARAGGADDRHQPGPGETAGAAPRPRAAPALFAGSEFRRARAGSGCAAAALWAAIQCRAYLERGVWGGSHVGSPSPSDEAPERRARGHEERVTKASSSRPATSERAAQGARAPPSRRCPAYAGRGCSEGSCCSIRCAAAWRPVVHALPRILLRVIPGW